MAVTGVAYGANAYTYAKSQKILNQRAESVSTDFEGTFQGVIGRDGKEHEKAQQATGTRAPQITTGQTGKVPYSELAEDGIVEYNGVIFRCDYEKNALCLGDTSNPDNCLSIPLSGGGSLLVNRDNLTDLGDAIGMFTPEDVNRILRAIAQDNQVQDKLNEVEEDENSVDEKTPLQQLRDQIEEMQNKLKNGDTEESFQIGAKSYTLKEWDKLLENFDKVQETLKEEKQAEEEKKEGEEQKKQYESERATLGACRP